MNEKLCPQFALWLERLPRSTLQPDFQRHLQECELCRNRFLDLAPIAENLATLPKAPVLNDSQLKGLADHVHRATATVSNRRLALRLILISVLCLPLLGIINWFWATTGYDLIAEVSPLLAQMYLILFIVSTTALSGLLYGSIPILVGFVGATGQWRNHHEYQSN